MCTPPFLLEGGRGEGWRGGLNLQPNFEKGRLGRTSTFRGGLPKKGGAWTVCQFTRAGLGKKNGVVFIRVGDTPNAHNEVLLR